MEPFTTKNEPYVLYNEQSGKPMAAIGEIIDGEFRVSRFIEYDSVEDVPRYSYDQVADIIFHARPRVPVTARVVSETDGYGY